MALQKEVDSYIETRLRHVYKNKQELIDEIDKFLGSLLEDSDKNQKIFFNKVKQTLQESIKT